MYTVVRLLLWGKLLVAIGIFLTICGWTESQLPFYRLVVARTEMLWGEKPHRFYQVVGIIIVVVGVLVALGLI